MENGQPAERSQVPRDTTPELVRDFGRGDWPAVSEACGWLTGK